MASKAGEVKVAIVGDASKLKTATSEAESSLNKLNDSAKKVGAGIAAAFGATAVVSFLKGAADAAREDELAQKLLSVAITDNTNATAAQIQQTEQWITVTQNATGVMDDQLRPALALLVGATHDVGTAQQLMNTVLDISAARGLDVETVALAVTKAYNGATAGLSRMGIQIKDTSGNALDFNDIMANANETFGGAAAAAAATSSGQMAILNARFKDMKEEIGNEVLPIMVAFESFILNHIIPVVSGFSLMIQQLPGNLASGVATVLNAILGAFQSAVNTIIGAVNSAINAFNNLPGMGIVRNIAGHLGLGSGKIGNIPQVSGLGVDVPYYPTGLTLAGANAGLGIGGGTYSPGSALDIGSGATGPIPAGGGGGGGGGGGAKAGKSDAQKAAEAALKDYLDLLVNARDEQRKIEDEMYQDGKTSLADYLAILEKRLTGVQENSDEWISIKDQERQALRDHEKSEVEDAKQAAEDLKKIQDQQLQDMQDALTKQQQIQDNMYEVGALSSADYLAILQDRLGQYEQFSNEWTRIYEEIQQLGGSSGAGFSGGGNSSQGHVGGYTGDQASSQPGGTVINIATITVPDPRGLVTTLQQIDRTYGGVPINVRTPA